jgi:hypothetical protein
VSLVAATVGPHDFAAYRWLVPVGVEHPSGWHYGLRRRRPHPGSAQVDARTLDPDLRELVLRLHREGVRTLPSCQGHFGWCPRRVQQAARDLAAQEPLLRRGLLMRDVETGVVYRARDAAWRAPSERTLLDGVRRWEGVGYLGVICPDDARWTCPHLRRMEHAVIQPVGRQINIWVTAPNQRRQTAAWRRVTEALLG